MDEHNHDHMHEVDVKLAEDVCKMSYEALLKAKSMVKPGAKLLDVADAVEKFVRDKGYYCAFPLNLSINEQAAHYTPTLMDEKVFGENDLVKVDFGAAKEGVLGDCAVTVDLSGKHSKLVEAAELALKNGISVIKDGVKVSDIGKEIGKTIEAAGFKPILNLGGHLVEVHALHSDIFVPNYDNHDETILEEGMTVAVEPFATDGPRGFVVESDICDIYSFDGLTAVRPPMARKLMEEIGTKYEDEPFAVRWLSNIIDDKFGLYMAIKELVRVGSLRPYPTLVSSGPGMIAQAEVEVLVEKEGCTILTK